MRSMSKVSLFLAVAAVSLYLVSAAPAQWSRNAGNSDVYLTNLSDDVGIGLNNPARQLHVRGENAIFRLDRWVNSPGFIISRMQYGIAAPLKTFHVGVKAWGVDEGRFFIEDLHTAEGGDGDVRLAIDEDGNVGIGTIYPDVPLQVVGGSDATLGGGGYFVTGYTTSGNIVMDTNEIMARNNGSASTLYLNNNGGDVITGTGDVGIGTTTPGFKLGIEDSSTGSIVRIYNTSTNTNADGLTIWLPSSAPGNGNDFIKFFGNVGGAGSEVGSIDGTGTGGVRYNTTGSDFAEWLPRLKVDEVIEPGDIVGVTAGQVSRTTTNSNYVQVVSTAPGWVGGCPGEDKESLYEQVAFLGQAPVKIRGAVQAGDFIIPSGRNDGTGVAVSPKEMDADRCGQIVGRTMESSDNKDIKLVRAVVGLHAASPALREVSREKDRQIEELTARMDAMEEKLMEMKIK
jgi:hypothetical protein